MPELPEVETTLRGIEPHILHKKILYISIRQPKLRWQIPVKEFNQNLPNNSFLSINRRGKYLILKSQKGFVLIHLGMSGCLRIFKQKQIPEKHDHVDIVFKDNSILRYTDPRRFGCMLWTKFPKEHSLLSYLGPEPLGNQFSGEYLYKKSRKRTVPIKNLIMDSKIVVGVGNIYANESLFIAGIRPTKKSGQIKKHEYEDLAKTIKVLLLKSIEKGGTTITNFVGGDNKPGYFKQELMVYGRNGKNCYQCNKVLQETKINQRSTVFCSYCQK